ncbi:phage tail protein [Citrobacter portucalensis]|uniref:Phage tail protein n=1 Tax=Citrobacter portucalensis TaxID=1639133 RepID=A0A5B0ST82_9ENTR|nr:MULTISPECIES: phage tail protein [Citrobacter]KAA1140895.1 phage tail protein [Citrobacter portucalensis]QRQ75875.1 phage tail protein [Citrobacter sp. B72]
MSAGTLTLTNNSAAVAGNGTEFTTEVAAGDFIVVTVGGVPYTLPVKSVESGTALTLVSNFTGPTQSGAAWSAVPRVALNMVTAALVAQSAEALRGLNYDKQNWQLLFSANGNITVRLPDNSEFTGPSWKYLADNMATKSDGAVPVNQGGTGSTNADGARTNLGVDALRQLPSQTIVYGPGPERKIAMRIDAAEWGCVVTENGNPVPLATKYGGTGAAAGDFWNACSNIGAMRKKAERFQEGDTPTNIYWANSWGFITGQSEYALVGAWIDVTSADNGARMQLIGYYSSSGLPKTSGFAYRTYNPNNQTWEIPRAVRDTGNTTVDSNGFIKTASPVVDVRGDGTFSVNAESEGCQVERLSVGVYHISGCLGLNSDIAWGGVSGGFEIPVDRNKQPRIWLDYKVNADGSVLVRTYHRVHPSAPPFAQNRIGSTDIDGVFTETVADGEPVDIPADSFVSIRVEMPEDSIWNQKQKETRDVTEKTERERQQNQQDTQ